MFSLCLVLNLPADVVRNLRSIDSVESSSATALQAQRVRMLLVNTTQSWKFFQHHSRRYTCNLVCVHV